MEKKSDVAEILAKKIGGKKCINLDKIWPKNDLKWPKIV